MALVVPPPQLAASAMSETSLAALRFACEAGSDEARRGVGARELVSPDRGVCVCVRAYVRACATTGLSSQSVLSTPLPLKPPDKKTTARQKTTTRGTCRRLANPLHTRVADRTEQPGKKGRLRARSGAADAGRAAADAQEHQHPDRGTSVRVAAAGL